MSTPTLALTFSPDTFHIDTLKALGEDKLTILVGRARLLEIATRDQEVFEKATGETSRSLQADTIRAGARFGDALMEFEMAVRRLQRAGLGTEAASLVEREHRRIRAIDRAS